MAPKAGSSWRPGLQNETGCLLPRCLQRPPTRQPRKAAPDRRLRIGPTPWFLQHCFELHSPKGAPGSFPLSSRPPAKTSRHPFTRDSPRLIFQFPLLPLASRPIRPPLLNPPTPDAPAVLTAKARITANTNETAANSVNALLTVWGGTLQFIKPERR